MLTCVSVDKLPPLISKRKKNHENVTTKSTLRKRYTVNAGSVIISSYNCDAVTLFLIVIEQVAYLHSHVASNKIDGKFVQAF